MLVVAEREEKKLFSIKSEDKQVAWPARSGRNVTNLKLISKPDLMGSKAATNIFYKRRVNNQGK